MPENQVKLIKTLLVFMSSITIYQALTIRRLSKNFAIGQQRFESLQEGANYLLNILEENDVGLTEFDLIALTEIVEGSPSV
jgi:hypothetical protein